MWTPLALTNKSQILDFLETDRLYAAYAIGDLEPGMFEQCAWFGAERSGRLEAAVMHFRGISPPALLLIGDPEGLRAALALARLPGEVCLTCRPEHVAMSSEFYSWAKVSPMWRMALRPDHFRPVAGESTRLLPEHSHQLADLYALGGGDAFSPNQIARGVFYGIIADRRLIAVAGTHLVSRTYGVAAVGNVFTHPDCRGRGYGAATTSAVVAELLARGIRDIVLNVGEDNVPAIHLYERLGFELHCRFTEGPASPRKSTG